MCVCVCSTNVYKCNYYAWEKDVVDLTKDLTKDIIEMEGLTKDVVEILAITKVGVKIANITKDVVKIVGLTKM